MPTTFENSARHALLAMLSATLLAACGGGDFDAELDAAVATGQVDPGAAPTVSFEAASAHASRSPMGIGRRAPICMFAPPDCQPNLPPTQ
jgi:hypothetical protein